MIVVWGWNYFFRKNHRFVVDVCDHCQQTASLACYDALYFFTLYYCPIIPLGRRRVLRECPHCKFGVRMPMREYDALIASEFESALQDLTRRPSDKEAAGKALSIAIEICYQEGFTRAAAAVAHGLRTDAQIAELLGIGHAQFGDREHAERVLLSASAADASPTLIRRLVAHYLKSGETAKASAQVRRLLESEGESAVDVALVHARVLQSAGQHREVVNLLDEVKHRFPETSAEEVRNLRNASSQLRDSDRPTVVTPAFDPPKPRRGILPALVLPALLLVGFLIYLSMCAFGSPDNAFLVNGLDTPYHVLVNGESVALGPRADIHMPATFGKTRIEPGPDAPDFEPIEFDIESGFFARPFYDEVHVVNPDGLAAIIWEQVAYADTAANAPDSTGSLLGGKRYYTFSDVDYVFKDPPTQISMSNSSSVVYKSHVYASESARHEDILMGLLNSGTPDDAIPYVKRLMDRPEASLLLMTLAQGLLPEDEFASLLDQQRTSRPVRVQAHRFWQTWKDLREPDYDLIGEYRALLKAEPNDRDLAYLLARIVDDHEESVKLLEQAIEPPNPSPFGHFALAYNLGNQAEFAKALPHARKAMLEITNDENVPRMFESMLLANGDIDSLESHLVNTAFDQVLDDEAAIKLVRVIATRDRKEAQKQADKSRQAAIATWNAAPNDARIITLKEECAMALLEGAGDRDALLAQMEASGTLISQLRAAFIKQDLESISRLLDKHKDAPVGDLYMLYPLRYVIAMRQHRSDIADEAFEAMVQLCEQGNSHTRRLAAMLQANQSPAATAVAQDMTAGANLAIMLIAFSERFPDEAHAYLALARKQNFELAFPRMVLDDLL